MMHGQSATARPSLLPFGKQTTAYSASLLEGNGTLRDPPVPVLEMQDLDFLYGLSLVLGPEGWVALDNSQCSQHGLQGQFSRAGSLVQALRPAIGWA